MKIESRLAQIGSIQEPVTGAVSFPVYQATASVIRSLGRALDSTMHVRKARHAKCWRMRLRSLESGDAGFACQSGNGCAANDFRLFQSRRSSACFA